MIRSVYRDKLFEGKTALITGGGTGIGLRTARELAALGACVIVAGRRQDVLAAAVQQIKAGGGSAHAVVMNVREQASVEAGIDAALAATGQLDFLVNNAGGQFPAPAESIARKGWDAVIETNLTGPFTVAQAAFQKAFKQRGGAVVNVIANVRSGFPTMAHTGAARAGVDNLTKTLATEWGRYGVRVNAVAPGIIASSGLDSYGPELKKRIATYGQFNAAYRLGSEAEVANAILFFLTPAAQFLTGVTLAVDGGESLYSPLMPPVPHTKLSAWED